jgi:hypothetical protein
VTYLLVALLLSFFLQSIHCCARSFNTVLSIRRIVCNHSDFLRTLNFFLECLLLGAGLELLLDLFNFFIDNPIKDLLVRFGTWIKRLPCQWWNNSFNFRNFTLSECFEFFHHQ